MLGCVVSLTSSHLSGSTIRDMDTGGSVLCSNSSFSSLLHSPNTEVDLSEGTVTIPGSSVSEPFKGDTDYSFDENSGDQLSEAVFTNCHFDRSVNQLTTSPLSFNNYPGTISIESCSFTGCSSSSEGGAIYYLVDVDQYLRPFLTLTSSNFTHCSASSSGGAVYLMMFDAIALTSCRFEHCSTIDHSYGGAVYMCIYDHMRIQKVHSTVDGCVFSDCTTVFGGGGLYSDDMTDITMSDTTFDFCETNSTNVYSRGGGGILMEGDGILTAERCHFIECRTSNAGAAISFAGTKGFNISDILVKDCYSGVTGAIFISCVQSSKPILFSRVYMVGNSMGTDTLFFTSNNYGFPEHTPKFPDIQILGINFNSGVTIKFVDCFTTIMPDSSAMVIGIDVDLSTRYYIPAFNMVSEFEKIGPLLTAKPTAKMNEKTGKIELTMEGMMPPISQEYEVTVKAEDKTEARFRMLFSDGTGTLVSGSEENLKYITDSTIMSIVGVVPESSSSRMTNDIEVPVAAWAFNLAATPNYLSFTTPEEPSTLISATANLISDDPKYAHLLIVFNENVKGSFDIVVEEEGKDVTITVSILEEAQAGESSKFIVVGEDRLLTHDTTYTIQSIVPTPGTDSPFVFMNKTITFHIPKWSHVPPEEPEDPEDPTEPFPEDPEEPEDPTEPEPEDPKNKKLFRQK
ncbi:hypothetical protein BLNAU_9262 [Blattamonas nauphoetae]|uniref:Right handed beta helix domain-containing protein n=1 Tax=Blattamonas nauphoetae TaxID=2049346 RepID=A0ABQ9XW86_9EUKA|nr:hypothetical protein BLNAU_9262 [Blattamonas nauphoetae]